MKQINVPTKRGSVLNGVLFHAADADTVVIAITGIHGNFYSNPFYYKMLPFYFMGWVECIAYTAYDWLFTDILNNVRVEENGDFSALSKITHTGALLISTYDNFAGGDTVGFLQNINNHMQTAKENKLIYIEKAGHTYQQKHQETADALLKLIMDWRK